MATKKQQSKQSTQQTPQNNPSLATQITPPTSNQTPWNYVIGQDPQGNVLTLGDLQEISKQIPGLDLAITSKGDQSVLLKDPYVEKYNEILLQHIYPAWEENAQAALMATDQANQQVEEYNKWIMGQAPHSTPHQRLGSGLSHWGISPYGGPLLRGKKLSPPPLTAPPPLEKSPRGSVESHAAIKIGTPEPQNLGTGNKKREPLRITDVQGTLVTYGLQKRADQTLRAAAEWWAHFQTLQQNIATIFDFDKNNIGGSWQNHVNHDTQIQFKDQNGNTRSFTINPSKSQSLGANMLYYLATYMKNDPSFAQEVSSAFGQKIDTKESAVQIAQKMAQLIHNKVNQARKSQKQKFADALESQLGRLFGAWTRKLEVLVRNVPYLQKRAQQIFNKYETDFNNDKEILDDMGALLTFYTLREADDIANQDSIFQQLSK